jgi:hypothetical protein
MYLDINLNVVSSYGSSLSFLAPDSNYGSLGHLQHDVPEPGWRIVPEVGNCRC